MVRPPGGCERPRPLSPAGLSPPLTYSRSMASRVTSPATLPASNRTSRCIPTIGMRGWSWAPSGTFRAAPRARATSSFGSTIPSASRISPLRPFCTPRIRSKSDPSPSHRDGEFDRTLFNRARAVENFAYVVAANQGASAVNYPPFSWPGGSMVVDYDGRILAQADPGPGEKIVVGPIDLAALRAERLRRRGHHLLSHLRVDAYTDLYARPIYRPGSRST